MTVQRYECSGCGLIHESEALNLVESPDSVPLGNYCPNCGAQDLDTWRPDNEMNNGSQRRNQ